MDGEEFEPDPVMRVINELQGQERELSDERRGLHERIDTHGDELATRRERDVSAKRRDLHRLIDRLRQYPRPFKREPRAPDA